MKKIILKILLILIAILFLWAGFNLLTDIKEPEFKAGEGFDTSSVINFLNDLFPPVPMEKENGYYRLFALTEPLDKNIESDEIFKNYKQIFDPETARIQYIKEYKKNNTHQKRKEYYKKTFSQKRKKILEKSSEWVDHFNKATGSWAQLIKKEKNTVMEMQILFSPLIKRYHKVIDSNYFQDLTIVVIGEKLINFDIIPIPNLLAWLHTAKQFLAYNILNAVEGEWITSTGRILDHLDFNKRATKGSRTLITNLVSKAILKMSLVALSTIMNQPDCPEEIFQLILSRMPDIKYEEYGSRIPILAESFHTSQIKSINPLLQNNRTKKYLYDHFTRLVNSERIPPFQWKSSPREYEKVMKGFFWWVQNPFGKILFEKHFSLNLATVVFKSWHTKVLYDMTKISAELHMKYDPSISVRENLDGLDSYRSLQDPCSGKPYKWHEKKQMLYSYGADRDDDGGKDGPITSWDADFILSVILYIK